MIKVGHIGFGDFGQHRYKVLQKITGVKSIGFFDINKKIFFKKLKSFKSLDELLKCVDAVIVAVPPAYASKISFHALKKGIHVFCEKPPAVNSIQLKQLKQLSNKYILAYGFNHRLHDSIIEIKRIVDSRKMGKILWMRGRYGKEVDKNYKNNWRCSPKLNGGGILIDQGIHLLDLMNWFSGEFDYIQGLLSNTFLKIKSIEDNAFLNLYSSKSNISASLHSTITQWRYLFALEIIFEKGSVVLNGLRTRSGSYGNEILTIKPNKTKTNKKI